MTDQTEKLLADVLQLPPEGRATILDALLTSEPLYDVDHGPDEPRESVEAAWQSELERRLDDVKTGRVEAASFEDAWPRITGRNE